MMRQSHKLDALQELAKQHAGETHRLYVIQLLAEHAEEEEMSAEFLRWITDMFMEVRS